MIYIIVNVRLLSSWRNSYMCALVKSYNLDDMSINNAFNSSVGELLTRFYLQPLMTWWSGLRRHRVFSMPPIDTSVHLP